MSVNIHDSEAPVRENRLGSITGYDGSAKDLVCKSVGCSLQNRGRCFSQPCSCSSFEAQYYLSGIIDALIVNHAPIGCAADSIGYNLRNKSVQKRFGWKPQNINFFSTNMTKEDTVFGATEKLKDTIKEAYRRYKPKAIFVTTSCVSGIIGEDIQSALDELKEEIPIPLAPVFCEGFKSGVFATGFDAAYHALLTNIVKPPRQKTNKVNIFNFEASARAEITEIFTRLGLKPVFLVSQCTVEEISTISEAAASMGSCGTLATYIGNALEQLYGVPFVKMLNPLGVAGFESWLRGLAQVTGKEAEAEAYIQERRKGVGSELEEIKKQLKGRTAVVGMGSGFAFDFVNVLEELGVKVIKVLSWHYDQKLDDGNCSESARHMAEKYPDLSVSVSDQQGFELANLLHKMKPDFYISRHSGTIELGIKMGIVSLIVPDEYAAFGYNGIIDFGYRMIDAMNNRSLEKNLARRLKHPYTEWWLKQDAFKLLDKEVE